MFSQGVQRSKPWRGFAIEKSNMEIDDDLTSDDSELRSAEIYTLNMESEIFI